MNELMIQTHDLNMQITMSYFSKDMQKCNKTF